MKERLTIVKNWIIDHNRFVMAGVLVICVAVTIVVALSANKKDVMEDSTEVMIETPEEQEVVVTQQAVELNAYPFINDLCASYFTARATGDMDTLIKINPSIGNSDTSRLFFEKMSEYIDSYNDIEVYTKNGPSENTYVAYVKYYLKLKDREELIPGMESYFVPMNESGEYTLMDRGESDEAIENYIAEISLQDDIVELNNKVGVEYNDLISGNEELSRVLNDIYAVVTGQVGTEIAENDANVGSGSDGEDQSLTNEENTEQPDTIVEQVKTTTTVNVRSSDSENADKIGKAQAGQIFDVIETKANGWVKIKFERGEGYIKGTYLQVVSESVVNDDGTTKPVETAETVTGTVTVKTTVNIRAAASETADKIGVAYEGEKLDLVTKQADGWCKINYNGRNAYVKSEFVE